MTFSTGFEVMKCHLHHVHVELTILLAVNVMIHLHHIDSSGLWPRFLTVPVIGTDTSDSITLWSAMPCHTCMPLPCHCLTLTMPLLCHATAMPYQANDAMPFHIIGNIATSYDMPIPCIYAMAYHALSHAYVGCPECIH